MANILIIDDERSIRNTLKEILEFEGFQIDDAKDGNEGWEKIQKNEYDLVICDIKMPGIDGMELLSKVMEVKPELQFIMISGHGTIETAIDATRRGAFDFIEKPADLNRLLVSVRNALDKKNLVVETKTLKKKVGKSFEMIGNSPALNFVRSTIEKVAPTEARVLITGPNGAGKELVARAIHSLSLRSTGPMIEVNCAAIPSELIESELFGHEKGAFTTAIKQRLGKFEQANGGTLFLDEIGDMSLSAQAKVLRALQEHKITRVGGEKDISVNVRVIAATNKDLKKEIEAGRFREDLFHRLGVIIIQVPGLNDRKEDIPLLAQHFISLICQEYGYPERKIDSEAIILLQSIDWTGNIRELRNVMERLVIFSDKVISAREVELYVLPNAGLEKDIYDQFEKYQEFRDVTEKEFILRKLIKNNWNVTKTAEELDIQRSHLYTKIEKFNLQRDQLHES